MLKIVENLVTADRYPLKCPHALDDVRLICVHNTANDANALDEVNYMRRNALYTSYHYAVDETQAVQGVPLDRNTWHAGDGANGYANRHAISVEICHSKSGGEKFAEAERNAAELIADLLYRYGLSVSDVRRHCEFAATSCPARTNAKGWARFLDLIKSYKKKGFDMEKLREIAQMIETLAGDLIAEIDRIESETPETETEGKGVDTGKTIEAVAREVIAGDWSNGKERREKLTAAGYDPDEVQNAVNKILYGGI